MNGRIEGKEVKKEKNGENEMKGELFMIGL